MHSLRVKAEEAEREVREVHSIQRVDAEDFASVLIAHLLCHAVEEEAVIPFSEEERSLLTPHLPEIRVHSAVEAVEHRNKHRMGVNPAVTVA